MKFVPTDQVNEIKPQQKSFLLELLVTHGDAEEFDLEQYALFLAEKPEDIKKLETLIPILEEMKEVYCEDYEEVEGFQQHFEKNWSSDRTSDEDIPVALHDYKIYYFDEQLKKFHVEMEE